jgi:predicted metal-dependent hydrolase
MDEREALNRAVAEHLERLRRRLAEDQSELERQRASVDATHEHMAGMSRWIAETDRQLSEERARRDRYGGG